jgi:hypothetical protein
MSMQTISLFVGMRVRHRFHSNKTGSIKRLFLPATLDISIRWEGKTSFSRVPVNEIEADPLKEKENERMMGDLVVYGGRTREIHREEGE